MPFLLIPRILFAIMLASLFSIPAYAQGGGYPSNAVAVWGQDAVTGLPCLVAPGPSGSLTCTLPARNAQTLPFNETATPLTGSATFTGSWRSTGVAVGTQQPWAFFTALFRADQAGTAFIDCSNDGGSTSYICATTALAASTTTILQVPVTTQYHRVRLVNGATTETALNINSAYSAN